MSLKKELKIKRLRRKALLPRVIGIILVDILLASGALYFGALTVLSMFTDTLVENYKSCNTVVQIVNAYKTDAQSLSEKITEIEKLDDSIAKVYLVDDDFKIINAFDNDEIEFKNEFQIPLAKMDLAKNGIFRNEIDEYDDVLVEFEKLSLNSLNIYSLLFKKNVLDTAIKASAAPGGWIAIKTETDNLNVCIKTVYSIYPDKYNMFCLLLLSIVAAVLATGIYELKKIVIYIIEQRKVYKLVYTDTVTGGNNKEYFIRHSAKYIKKNSG